MAAEKKALIRVTTLFEKADAVAVGSAVFLKCDLMALTWQPTFQCVCAKLRSHPDLVSTNVKDRDDLEAFLAGLA